MVVAIGLDIKNAFNTLPWSAIKEALRRKGFPDYIGKIITDYLSNRAVEYVNGDGVRVSMQVTAGVPQGSVLGPVLWNITYDQVLRGHLEEGCKTICFADDTLVMAEAMEVNTALARANVQIGLVLNQIKRLGLEVAPQKTEFVCFAGRKKIGRTLVIDINGVEIEAKRTMRYLGVILDDKLTFGPHLEYVESKVTAVSRSLYRITPNLRGPRESRRRLYGGMILSVILYAAPVWCEAVNRARKSRDKLNGLVRSINLRIVAGYRTISLEASSILARMPPVHLQADMRLRMFYRVSDLKSNDQLSAQKVNEIRGEETLLMIRQWGIYMQRRGVSGVRVRDAFLPCLRDWMERSHGSMEFHLTQLVSGHGCFASFLCRIQKIDSDDCEHCDSGAADTADHTLRDCVAWSREREELEREIGEDLSLATVVQKIIKSKDSWDALANFARAVMRKKEEAERERERRAREANSRSPSLYSPGDLSSSVGSSTDS